MTIASLRSSRFFRALVLTTGPFSLLLWVYIVVRIVFNDVDVTTPFVDAVPFISFEVLGVITFFISFVCTLLYLWLWGRAHDLPMPPPSGNPKA